MRDARSSAATAANPWRELYRCDDLRQARAVATCIAAMEFDVRLCATATTHADEGADMSTPGRHDADVACCTAALHPCACSRIAAAGAGAGAGALARDEDLPGPYTIEVPGSTWPQLADVLMEIIAEQQEFDQMLELRRQQNRTRLIIVLSITTAAEVLLIWRLLEG
jgi:hypothetical protein